MRKDDFQAVKESSLLQDLTDQELERLAAVCQEKELAEGMTVFIENMPGESLYLIREGAVRISRLLGEGDEETLVILGPEEVFGEVAVLDKTTRAATARVVEKARLISLGKAAFEKLCQDEPRLGLKLMRNLFRVFSQRVRESSDEYREMLRWSLGRE